MRDAAGLTSTLTTPGGGGTTVPRVLAGTCGTVGTVGTWRTYGTSLYLTSMCLDSPDSPENRPETVAVLGIVRFDTGPER